MLSKDELNARIAADRRAVLVSNTHSRRGERLFARARSLLEERGVRVVESYPVRNPVALPKIVQQAIDAGYPLVVVGGGDGTLSSISGLFAYRDSALGVLPLGTGNSFAQTLQIPRDLPGAIDVIARGKVVDVDLGKANDSYFANVATIGLSAVVARRTPRSLKRILGPLAYVVVGAAQTFVHSAFRAQLFSSNADVTRDLSVDTHLLIVANGRVFGQSPLFADAHVDNRRLAVFTMRGKSRWQIARLWAAFFTRRQTALADATFFLAQELRVDAAPVQYLDVDGEVIAKTPIHFSIAPEALRVMVPSEFVEPWG